MCRLNYIFLFLIIAVLFSSCTKEKNAPSKDFHYEYFPLKLKNVIVYDVDSTYYNNFNSTINNFKFELKDSVASVFTSFTGDSIFRVERYKKENNASVWTYQKTIARSRSLRVAEETIDNQTFIRLNFPPETYKEWNGNSKNTLENQPYYITDFPFSIAIGNYNLDSALVVQQIDEENLSTKDFAYEIYAPHIGLIKKEVIAVEFVFGTNKINKGYAYTMQIKSHSSY